MLVALVDVSYVMYKAFYAVCSYWSRKGKPVDKVRALDCAVFARQLRVGLARDLTYVHRMEPRPDHVFFVTDCRREENWRVEGGEGVGYKGSRAARGGVDARLHEVVHESVIPAVQKLWTARTLSHPGAEADDIIAVLKTHWAARDPDARFVILTNDGDYAQLHDSRTRIVNLQGVDVFERERARFVAALGEPCDVARMLTAKALRGDKSDDVPPVCSRLRRARVRELLDDPARLAELEGGPLGAAYRANRRLVDLGLVPEAVRAGIIAAHGGALPDCCAQAR